MGEEVGIKGDENITTKATADGVGLALNKDLKKMNSVTAEDTDGNKNVMSAKGNTITDNANNSNTSTATGNTVKNASGDTTRMTADGVTYNSKDNLNSDGSVKDSKKTIGFTKDGLNAESKQIKNVADGEADSDAANMKQVREAAATSKVEEGKNISVTTETDPATKAKTYKVALKDTVTLGEGDKAVKVDGVTGTVTAGTGENAVGIDGKNAAITAGTGDKAVGINGKNATIKAGSGDKAVTINGTTGHVQAGKVAVDGTTGTVSGLTNTDWDPEHITTGRAATEDQLKKAAAQAKTKVEAGSTNVKVDEKVNPDKSKTYVVDLGKDLKDLNSVTTGGAKGTARMGDGEMSVTSSAGNKTVLNGSGMVISSPGNGPVVSLTNKGLNNGGNKITNVGAGTVALGSMDAVNGDQLARVVNKVGEVGVEVNQAGALSAALAALKPIQYDPLEPTQIMAGFGTYRSSNAIALGIAHYNNESTMMHAGVSYAGGSNHHIMANLGVTWKVGSGATEEAVMESYRKGPVSSVYALQNEVRDLKAENSQMRKDNEEMRKDNEELKQQLAKVMEKLGMA